MNSDEHANVLSDTEASDDNVITAHQVGADIDGDALLEATVWRDTATPAHITRYWSGKAAPLELHTEARVVWSAAALCVRFACRRNASLVLNDAPQFAQKTIGLWERDVCEVFIAPDARQAEKYYEFEVAPTGEWLDLAIHQTPASRETDWHYASGMSARARINANSIVMGIRLPWQAFGRSGAPQKGDEWLINLFRCVGAGAQRGYLAWRPTRTAQPNFHVPAAFGQLRFD